MTCNLLFLYYTYILFWEEKQTLTYYGHSVYLPSMAPTTYIDKFISNLYQLFEIHCSIRDVCFSQNSISWIVIWSFIYKMEIEVSWRMQFFLFMGIDLYVNEFFFKSIRQLVYFLFFSVCQKVVYFLIFLKYITRV